MVLLQVSLAILPKVNMIAKSLSLRISNEVLIEDFEATFDNCKRLGIDQNQFFKLMRESCKKFEDASSEKINAGFFTGENS